MTAAYAAFANQGRVPTPVLIRRVEDRDGTLLYQSEQLSSRAISETTAFLMSNMMADVINAGTAAGARTLGFKLPAAGKTGTTNDFNDAWFIGFTPKLVTGVWVGFDQPHTILPERFCGGHRGAALDVVHEGGHGERQAGMVHAALRRHDRHGLPHFRQARGRRDAITSRSSARMVRSRRGRWSTPSTSRAAPSRPSIATCTRRHRGLRDVVAGVFPEQPRGERPRRSRRPPARAAVPLPPGRPAAIRTGNATGASCPDRSDCAAAARAGAEERFLGAASLGRGKDRKKN